MIAHRKHDLVFEGHLPYRACEADEWGGEVVGASRARAENGVVLDLTMGGNYASGARILRHRQGQSEASSCETKSLDMTPAWICPLPMRCSNSPCTLQKLGTAHTLCRDRASSL